MHGADLGATDRDAPFAGKVDDHSQDRWCANSDVFLGSNGIRQRRWAVRGRFAASRRSPGAGHRGNGIRQGNGECHVARPSDEHGASGSHSIAGARGCSQASEGHGSGGKPRDQYETSALGVGRSRKVVAGNEFVRRPRTETSGSCFSLRNANVVILTDETEFARLLTACWQAERQAPNITVLNSDSWREQDAPAHDLVVVGPVRDGKITSVLRSLEPANAVILCIPADSREFGQLRTKYPRLLHIPLREDWAQTLLIVAGESLRRAKALQIARQAERNAAKNENHATLGRYILEMKHSVNNALTSMLGNAELLLLEPGQLSSQSLAQIKTMHSMALRINEVMQRFSSLASEMQEAENASQAETEETVAPTSRRR